MALIEATNDYFQQVVEQVAEFVGPNKTATDEMAEVYRKQIGKEPETTRAEGLLLEAFDIDAIKRMPELLTIFLSNKQFLIKRISEKAQYKLLFRQPAILAVYMLAHEHPANTKQRWPLTPEELRPIYTDLGMTFDNY
jgi:putative GTP pyrophosphokinase